MNMLENTTKGLKLRGILGIFVILFLIGSTSIHSQNILDTTKRDITYEKLGEFAKYVAYKDSTQNVFKQYREELKAKDDIISIKDARLENKDKVISLLEQTKNNQQNIITGKNTLIEFKEMEITRHKKGKLGYGVVGVVIGLLTGIVLAVSL